MFKKINEITQDSNDGFPVYRRRKDGKTVTVKGKLNVIIDQLCHIIHFYAPNNIHI
jgi:hypothetical protein